MRGYRHLRALAAVAAAVVGLVVPGGPVAADPGCSPAERRFFAVASDGRLHELMGGCADDKPTVEDLGVVDGDDWRAFARVTAASDGPATTFWMVDGDGRLVRRVQAGPGAALGPAEVADAKRDWRDVRLLLATPHALLVDYPPVEAEPMPGPHPQPAYTSVLVFRPTAAGLVEDRPLFEHYLGPPLSAVVGAHAEIISGLQHRQAWRSSGSAPDNLPLNSGTLRADLHGYAGDADLLGGLDATGRIVVVRQHSWVTGSPPLCVLNAAPFTTDAVSASGGWLRLVVPGRSDPEAITRPPKACEAPYEWQ